VEPKCCARAPPWCTNMKQATGHQAVAQIERSRLGTKGTPKMTLVDEFDNHALMMLA
jgi:hypothetical protein